MIPRKSEKILVTGGTGFLGKAVCEALRDRGYGEIAAPGRAQYDLTKQADVFQAFHAIRPSIVIHLAAVVGGIGINRVHPGKFFYENALMGLQVMEQARVSGVRKMVSVGTVCSYPRDIPLPFSEEDLWNGFPEATNAPYGLAKRMLLAQAEAYREEYGFNAISLIPTNLYGPGDNFDPLSSHVIPALIRKCIEAKSMGLSEISVWGDGAATREFLYVEDAARGIVQAMESYNEGKPVNLGSGEEISIRDLTDLIARLTGFSGRISWDPRQPSGQARRRVDTRRAKREFGFEPMTFLEDGIARTVEWALTSRITGPEVQ